MQQPRTPCEPGARRLPAAPPGPATFGPCKPTAHPPGPATCSPRAPGFAALREVLDETNDTVPVPAKMALQVIVGEIDRLQATLAALEAEIKAQCRDDETCQRLMKIEGVGEKASIYSLEFSGSHHSPISFRTKVKIDGKSYPTVDNVQEHLIHFYEKEYMHDVIPKSQ